MTSEQEKQYIVAQRAMGKSFAQIGRELGRGESSIRYIFNRCMSKEPKPNETAPRMGMETKIPGAARCKYCGRDFAKPALGGKRLFCSDHCRNAWCNEQKRRVPYSRVCEQCGREFTAFGNPHKRFCSEVLTDHAGDMEYEYWKLVRDYSRVVLRDINSDKRQENTEKKGRDKSSYKKNNKSDTGKWSMD